MVLPPLCFVLGWTYVASDEKVTTSGAYPWETLSQALTSTSIDVAVSREGDYRLKTPRCCRKVLQLPVDQVLFCGSGVGAILAYLVLSDPPSLELQFLALVDAALMLLLSWQILRYASVDALSRYTKVGRGPGATTSRMMRRE